MAIKARESSKEQVIKFGDGPKEGTGVAATKIKSQNRTGAPQVLAQRSLNSIARLANSQGL